MYGYINGLLLLFLHGEKGFPVIIKYFVIGHVAIIESVHSLTYFQNTHTLESYKH